MKQFVATVEHTCLCGGSLFVSDPNDPNPITVAHTLPPCDTYECIDSVDDVADLLKRINEGAPDERAAAEQPSVTMRHPTKH